MEPASGTLSVRAAAREHPTRVAVALEDREVSWAELCERVGRAEGVLLRARLSPDAPLALTARRSLDDLALVLAAIERGVPLVLVHPRLPDAERARVLGTIDAGLRVDDASELGLAREPVQSAREHEELVPSSRCLAVVFTSGSTGTPRGVVLSRRAFVASAVGSAKNLGWRDDDRWLLAMPLAHVGGLSIVVRCLLSRTGVVLAREGPFDAESLAALAVRRCATLASLVPTMLHRVLEAGVPLGTLRAILLGGASAPRTLLERADDAKLPVLTTYGLTEACSQVTVQRLGTRNRGERGAGHPLDGTTVRIVGGRIHVHGPTLCDRYLDGPARQDDGSFATSDLGEIDEHGRLHVLGRLEDRIVTGGENVAPAAVERALLADPRVIEACVVGVPDPEWGEVVAAVVVAPTLPSPDAILSTVRSRLAPHERPRRVLVVPALPVGPNGKIDRREARSLLVAG